MLCGNGDPGPQDLTPQTKSPIPPYVAFTVVSYSDGVTEQTKQKKKRSNSSPWQFPPLGATVVSVASPDTELPMLSPYSLKDTTEHSNGVLCFTLC